MKDIYNLIVNNPLFSGIALHDFDHLFTCLSPTIQHYQEDEIIVHTGDPIHTIGILLSGSANIIKEDQKGNQSILSKLSTSDIFAEVFACAHVMYSPVSVVCTMKCSVIFIDYHRMVTTCTSSCPFHAKLIENMLSLIAHKTLLLHQKNELLSKRTTREKVLLFIDNQRGSAKQFTIPYNREQMAQYLCVDRSALSYELSKMRKEGLIDFHKNTFKLL